MQRQTPWIGAQLAVSANKQASGDSLSYFPGTLMLCTWKLWNICLLKEDSFHSPGHFDEDC